MKKPKEEDNRVIIYNSVTCADCNTTLVSYHRHDYKTCSCENRTSVDGGSAYHRKGGKDLAKVQSTVYYNDDDFEIVRKHAVRGSRGKDGKQPLTWIPICEMSDEYLAAVLEYGAADWHLEIICKELQYRHKHGIKISEA